MNLTLVDYVQKQNLNNIDRTATFIIHSTLIMQIYHNPRCQKSRQALELLKDLGHDPEIILYLEDPPTIKELRTILKKLKLKPIDFARKTEKIFKENFKDQELTDKEWVEAAILTLGAIDFDIPHCGHFEEENFHGITRDNHE